MSEMLQAEKPWFYYSKQNTRFPESKILPFALHHTCHLSAPFMKPLKKEKGTEVFWIHLRKTLLFSFAPKYIWTQWHIEVKDVDERQRSLSLFPCCPRFEQSKTIGILEPLWQFWSNTEGTETFLYFFKELFRTDFLIFSTFPYERFTGKNRTGGTPGWNITQSQVGLK